MCPIEDDVVVPEVVHGDTTESIKLTFVMLSRLVSSVSMEADMAGEVVAVDESEPPVTLSADTCPSSNIPSEAVSSRLDEPIEGHSSWCAKLPISPTTPGDAEDPKGRKQATSNGWSPSVALGTFNDIPWSTRTG